MAFKIDAADLSDMFAVGSSSITVSEDGADKAFHFSKGNISFKEGTLRKDLILVEGFYHLDDNMLLTGRGDSPLLEMQFNLSSAPIFYKNDLNKSEWVSPMSGNIMFDAENDEAKIGFKKDVQYHTFDVHLPFSLLMRYEGESRAIDHFLHAINKGKSMLFSDHPIPVNPKILSVIDDIKHCPYTGITRKIYLDAKVHELLALIYDRLANQQEAITLSSYDKERIYHAEQLIRKNINQPHTIFDLSNMVGINQTKLKQGFKAIFGATIFAYLQEIRMNKAKQYLLESDLSIQEISLLSGYNNLSNFSAAFKRTFGYPPTKLRKDG